MIHENEREHTVSKLTLFFHGFNNIHLVKLLLENDMHVA